MPLKDYASLLRPLNCFIASLAVFVGAIVSTKIIFFDFRVFLAMASAFLVCGAGQAINDYFDAQVDKKKNPKKPIPSGKIKKNNALIFSLSLFLTGIILAYFINLAAFSMAIFFSIILFIYSWKLAKAKYVGNIVVALGTAAPIFFGATIVGEYYFAAFFSASAFFANIGRELTKDVEDKNADEGTKTTLAHVFQNKTIASTVLFSYALAIAIALSLWFSKKIVEPVYALLVLLAGLVFLQSWFLLEKNNPKKSQTLSKTAMVVSLVAFVSWVFL